MNEMEFVIVTDDSLIGSRYSVYVVPKGATQRHGGKFVRGADTLWGAGRIIRKERRRRKRHGADGRIVHREAL